MVNPKIDPIRDAYYAPLEDAERWQNIAFLVAAALSFAVIFVEKSEYPKVYNSVHALFVVMVIAVFVIGHGIRLYLSPRAEGSRRTDLLANAFDAHTAYPKTVGYYNNNQTVPLARLGANVFESAFFSKAIVLDMARGQRWKIAIYAIAWLATAAYHSWDLALSAACAQAVFSEEILSRWLRLEWLRGRFETSFDRLAKLYEALPAAQEVLERRVIEEVCFYETSKANGGVVLSSEVFGRMNEELNKQWEQIRASLKL